MPRPEKAGREKNAAATQMADALQGFLCKSGLAAAIKHPGIHDVWQRIVGPELAKHTRVTAFRRGVVEVAADSSALLNDLQFHRAALLKDFQREVKRPCISRIVFVLMADRNEDEQDEPERSGNDGG